MRYVRFIINLNITYEINKSIKLIKYFNLNYVLNKLDRKLIFAYIYMLKVKVYYYINHRDKVYNFINLR